jgi:hypothetical protein
VLLSASIRAGSIQKPLNLTDLGFELTIFGVGLTFAWVWHSMTFRLDINKAVAATAFLIQKAGGEHGMFVLLKTLYHADRSSLIKDHRTITGDNFVSMDKGPVLTEIYNFMKDRGDAANLAIWRKYFSEGEGAYGIKISQLPDLDYLSENEKQTLSDSFDIISSIDPRFISRWMHASFPEWQDPHGSSIPIDPKIILRSQNVSESEILSIEEETDAVKFAKSFLG